MRPKGKAENLEIRRLNGERLLQACQGIREAARLLEVSSVSDFPWKTDLQGCW